MRTSLIAGNWKMNLDAEAASALVEGLVAALPALPKCAIAVYPPFVYLAEVTRAASWSGGRVAVGAQNCHHEDAGAFTGEVSPKMVRDVGATSVLLGHSERRRDFREDDATIARKLRAALRNGLKAVVCVGETLDQRDAGSTLSVVSGQIAGALTGLDPSSMQSVTIAYEPVWAIGTGRNATPAQAVEVHAAIRSRLAELFGTAIANKTRILYGGSVTADNAAALLSEPEIDGALVGGASLKLDTFTRIVRAARA